MKASHDTRHGRLEVEWRLDDRVMTLAAVVPEGTTATVVLPSHPDESSVQVKAGEHRWSYEVIERAVHLTLGTTVREIVADGPAWAEVIAILKRYLPAARVDALPTAAADVPLAIALNEFSALPADGRQEIAVALRAH